MDDHMYEMMMHYAKCELIPRFQDEYEKCQALKKCASYGEMQALCVALNAVAPYAGYSSVSPSDFV